MDDHLDYLEGRGRVNIVDVIVCCRSMLSLILLLLNIGDVHYSMKMMVYLLVIPEWIMVSYISRIRPEGSVFPLLLLYCCHFLMMSSRALYDMHHMHYCWNELGGNP